MKSLCDNCINYPCDDSGIKMMRRCPAYMPTQKPVTNADRIRSMSDEELAEWLMGTSCEYDVCPPVPCVKRPNCKNCWLDWLKQECSDEQL